MNHFRIYYSDGTHADTNANGSLAGFKKYLMQDGGRVAEETNDGRETFKYIVDVYQVDESGNPITAWRPAKVTLGESTDKFDCYINDNDGSWKGWATPAFTAEQLAKVVEPYRVTFSKADDGYTVATFDDDEFSEPLESGPIVYNDTVLETFTLEGFEFLEVVENIAPPTKPNRVEALGGELTHAAIGQLAMLLGGRITRLIRTSEDLENEIFGLEIKTPDNKTRNLWFYSDFEGNGPGGFAIDTEE